MPAESFITDAYGALHNLTKGAFDAFAMNHNGEFDPDFGRVFELDFKTGFKQIMKKYGFEVAGFSSLSWADTFRSYMGSFFDSGMADVAAVAVGEAVAGPAGAGLADGGERAQRLHGRRDRRPEHPARPYRGNEARRSNGGGGS